MTPLLLLLACTADKGPADSGAVDEVALADGVTLTLDGDSVVLTVDGRELFATAPGQAIQARTVSEDVDASLGMWRFDRVDQVDVDLPVVGLDADGDTALVRLDGGTLRVESDGSRSTFTLAVDTEADAVAVPVRCDADATFYGFGEQHARAEHRGHAFRLFVSEQGIGRTGDSWAFSGDEYTAYFPMPWWLDARGFGLLWQTDHRVNVDLCATDEAVAWVELMQGDAIVWTVMHGPTPMDVVGQLGDQVGRPKAPPAWAYGTWLCMQGGIERVRAQVAAAEAAGIPATVLWVQDWTGRRENPGGGYGVQYRWEPDEVELYPGIADFFAELKADGYRIVGYVNPFVDRELQHWDEMEAAGMLPLHPETGEVYSFFGPRGDMTTADLSNPDTRAYIQDHLRAAVVDVGLDGWMADFAEWQPIDAELAGSDDPAGFHNRYPEAWQRLTREVMDELRPDGDWLMFARSGWTGVQSVAMIHWAGDQEADFEPEDGLPTVVPAMLTMGMSGQPFVTHDIAGFSGGPSSEELYLRWTELGAFTPFMRTHDGDARDENWRWDTDAATTAHFVRFAKVHQALGPELQALAADAAETGAPIVRHLMLAYPDDPEVRAIDDQFLLGPDLLVAPVLTEGATARDLYLPDGAWFDVWTGEEHTGGAWITVDAPVGSPPVFSRGADRTDLRGIE
ncbi:MAG: hypothetical protein H6742_08530 [Alphaproteobacteria bacterium]|nr:hypothetical protein [Alphaproteobacteria bacterium]